MAAKKCPNCNSECPVASNSCKKCLHVFKSRKGSSTSSTASLSPKQSTTVTVGNTTAASRHSDEAMNEIQGRRHTGRITRSKPNFYDSLHVEEQMKQQKLLLRKQMKQSKSDEDGTGIPTGCGDEHLPISKDSKDVNKIGEGEPKKRRRGRPPGITGKKTTNPGRILHTTAAGKLTANHHVDAMGNCDKDGNNIKEEEEDFMTDIHMQITPEKALQYNIVLDEINRKWKNASWKSCDTVS